MSLLSFEKRKRNSTLNMMYSNVELNTLLIKNVI